MTVTCNGICAGTATGGVGSYTKDDHVKQPTTHAVTSSHLGIRQQDGLVFEEVKMTDGVNCILSTNHLRQQLVHPS